MTAVRPPLEQIQGRFISLQPLRTDQLVELHAAIGHPLVFAGGYGGGPAAYRADAGEFAVWARDYLRFGAEPRPGARPRLRSGVRSGARSGSGPGSRAQAIDSSAADANVFAVRLHGGAHDGVLVGTTTLGDIDVVRESAHIGWSAFDPRVWGSQVNAEAKLLLLSSAFEHGFGRVKIQADAMNTRSRAAIERLGARYEGTVRRERRRPDGSWRDTVLYSILAEEWPEVRAGLHDRLSRFAGPVEFRSAEALRA